MTVTMERCSKRVMNLGDLLTQSARRLREKPAVIIGAQKLSWKDFAARVDALAQALADLGVDKGGAVLVQSRNCLEMLESIFAVWKTGAAWVPTNFRIHSSDIAHMASLSEASVLICGAEFPEHAKAARDAGVRHVITIGASGGEDVSYDDLIRHRLGVSFAAAPVEADDICWLFFTSGTTGKPKAAVLTHGQMAFVLNNYLCDMAPDISERDTSLVLTPLSHSGGLNAMAMVARGVTNVLTESVHFDPEEVFRLIQTHRIANSFAVPTMISTLVSHPRIGDFDLSSLRNLIYAAAPMLRAHQKEALRKLGPCLAQYYGLGEVTGNITVLPASEHGIDDESVKAGTAGFARTGIQIDIQDQDGGSLAPGEIGEICVIGPAVFSGYYRNDAANAKAFRDGWFRTGDLGHMDEDGFLFISGRTSDMFISGGSNIYPLEIEEKIAAHPLVREACVLGMPDETWGEVGHAVVSLQDGASLTHADLVAYLRSRIASYKIPRALHVVDELPKSAYGKITKNLVRALLAQKITN
jgi:fatty-acyl-CoA synthase